MTKKIIISALICIALTSVSGTILVEEKKPEESHPVVETPEWSAGSENIEVLEFLANLYLSNKKYDQALTIYKEIIRSLPVNARFIRIKFTIANLYNLQNKDDEAILTYREIIKDSKDSYPAAIAEYKQYEEQMKPYQEEFRAYTKAVRQSRKEGGQKPVPPVKPQVVKPIVPSPQELEMNIARAVMAITNIYQSNQKIDSAEKTLRDLVHEGLTKEFSWIVLYSLATLYESQHRYEDALNAYEELLKLEYKKGSIYYPLLPGTSVSPEVFQDYLILPNVTPSRPATILIYIANLYEKQDNYDMALKTYRRIIENRESLDTDIATAYFFMGNLYELLGKENESKACYKEIFQNDTGGMTGSVPMASRMGWLGSIARQRAALLDKGPENREK